MTVKLTEPEALAWLENAARKVPADQAIVELGVYQGGSLVHLARGSAAGNRAPVFGIDPWGLPGTYPGRPQVTARYGPSARAECERRLEAGGLRAWVTLIQGFSVAVAATWGRPDPEITLLHVDTRRTEESVLCDVEAWRPHLALDAWIAYSGASARFPGVLAALGRLHGDRWQRVGHSLAVARARW